MKPHTLTSINDQIQTLRREFAALRTSRSAAKATGKAKADLEYGHLCRIENLGHAIAADAAARRERQQNQRME